MSAQTRLEEPRPRPRVWRHDQSPPHACKCPEPWEITTDHPFEATHHATFADAIAEATRIGGLVLSEVS